ncbi:hypothetical protein ASPBRDRAFT_35076 [Aspergillus brasiliensis CBS 101740]|uniref:Uncharacterized protein n=1 Tax=Aspergillus brasiliensis (strain CBS 101740 / IMI 381727 / IBT 21946) TaxID=767769 RepID=A0A1L9U3R4_ASPBC|nr:hypothetical protein ASPBRDRAFT_35076 [Aspergillus brasiliensis CBS 101740]
MDGDHSVLAQSAVRAKRHLHRLDPTVSGCPDCWPAIALFSNLIELLSPLHESVDTPIRFHTKEHDASTFAMTHTLGFASTCKLDEGPIDFIEIWKTSTTEPILTEPEEGFASNWRFIPCENHWTIVLKYRGKQAIATKYRGYDLNERHIRGQVHELIQHLRTSRWAAAVE